MKGASAVFIAIMTLAAPMFSQITDPPKPAFEGVYINGSPPGSPARTTQQVGPRLISTQSGSCFATSSITLKTLIAYAYDLPDFKIVGGPDWVATQRFDVEAQVSTARRLPQDVQSILAERFQLQTHRETQDVATYRLVIAPGGPNSVHLAANSSANGRSTRGGSSENGDTNLSAVGVPFVNFLNFLSAEVGVFITNLTGFSGSYNLDFHWTRDPNAPRPRLSMASSNVLGGVLGGTCVGMVNVLPLVKNPSGPSIFTALEVQLGLLLQSDRGPVEFLVIDHAEKPSRSHK